MAACPTILTDRLTLRPFVVTDLDPLFAVMDTAEVRRALHVADDFNRGAAWATLTSLAGLWELRGLGQWALEERATGRFVGRAGLHWRPDEDWPGVEVGWTLDPAVWGLGYATEAGRRAVRYGFEELDVDVLHSLILPGNARSEAVAGRLGFTPWTERTMSFFPSAPHRVWRLVREDWHAGTASDGR